MKTRATLALAAVAGLASYASAQEVVVMSYSWREVNAGTNTLVASPNSILEPGEGARIVVSLNALVNGANAIGAQVNLTNVQTSPTNGQTYSSGTVAGIGSFVYDIVGDAGGATANGNWNSLVGGTAPFGTGSTPGIPQGGGAIVQAFGGGQSPSPGTTANGTNPVAQAFRGVWNPASFANRTVNFLGRASVAVPAGQSSGMVVKYSVNTSVDPEDPATWSDEYVGKYFAVSGGNALSITVAPAPSSVALLGLGALVAGRRRRSR